MLAARGDFKGPVKSPPWPLTYVRCLAPRDVGKLLKRFGNNCAGLWHKHLMIRFANGFRDIGRFEEPELRVTGKRHSNVITAAMLARRIKAAMTPIAVR
jgi:hypothetical protein